MAVRRDIVLAEIRSVCEAESISDLVHRAAIGCECLLPVGPQAAMVIDRIVWVARSEEPHLVGQRAHESRAVLLSKLSCRPRESGKSSSKIALTA